MASELDQSLDDIIKSKKSSGRGGGRGGRGSGSGRGYGPVRRSGRGGFRSTPYGQPAGMVTDRAWQHDMYDAGAVAVPAAGRAAGQGIETGTKLYVSNLDYGVSNDDVKELFSEIGELKRFSVHYDRSGRSKGTAEVVFARKADALAAMTRYNNVQLDGKPMKIELIGSTVAPAVPAVARVAVAPAIVAPFGFPAGGGGFGGRGRGGRGGARGRGRGRGRGRKSETLKTQEELDAELDQYNAKKDTMQS